jgi:DNA-binding response OmpR family regulator
MRKKVLIVDDEKDIVNFLEHFLQRFKIITQKATSGEEALLFVKKEIPDFIFLDIQMSGKDGLAVLKELKKMNAASKVIMITGRADKESQAKAKKFGALDYITKPLDLAELRKKIEKYIL